MSEVRAIAITVAKEGHEGSVRRALERLVQPGNEEEGVIQYELHVDVQNPGRFAFVEKWETSEAFDAHCNAPQIGKYWKEVEGLIERSEVIILKKID